MFTVVVVVLAMVAEISFAALHTQIVVFVDFFLGFLCDDSRSGNNINNSAATAGAAAAVVLVE